MQNIKNIKVTALGLPNNSLRINPISKLGLTSSSIDEYKDEFVLISLSKIKNLIQDLKYESHFIQHPFNADNYAEKFSSKILRDIDIENSTIKNDAIPNNNKKFENNNVKPNFDDFYKNIYELSLASSLYLNTTVASIDNDIAKNGYGIKIDFKNKIVSYRFTIYYKVSDHLIKRTDDSIKSEEKYKAIVINTPRIDAIFYFIQNVYPNQGLENQIRQYVYNKFLATIKKTTDVETLAFLYDNLPSFIKSGFSGTEDIDYKPFKLPDDLLWDHLNLFFKYDDKWLGSKDASHPLLNVISMMTPKYCIQQFRQNQKLVIDIYDSLDDENGFDNFFGIYKLSKTFDVGSKVSKFTNKDAFISLLNIFIQSNENDPEVAIFEPTGAHFTQGVYSAETKHYYKKVTSKLNSNLVTSDDNKDKVLIINYWESEEYLGKGYNQQGKVIDNYDYGKGQNEAGYYNPLDIVKFTQYDNKGEGITLNVPAIFVKYASDVKEWEKVHENIRFGANILMIVVGIATIKAGVGSMILYAAIADLGLAYADIMIQDEKKNLENTKEGKEFLENWEKVYIVGSLATLSPLAIKAVATYGPKIITSGEKLLQSSKIIAKPELYKRIEELTIKAINSIEIPNFNKTGLKILAKGFKDFPELINAKKLQEIGVIFAKGGEDTVAAIYKGVAIAYGKARIVFLQLRRALEKLKGKELEEYLDDLIELAGMAENLATTKNADLFLASAARLESLNITAKTALQYLDEALVHFNHHVVDGVVKQIGNNNCVEVVQVVEEYLRTGKIVKAIYSERQLVIKLSQKYGGSFISKTIPEIKEIMKEGERGIIYGIRNPVKNSHVFNVIKVNGELKLVDGQNGLAAVIRQQGYVSFQYLKVN